jgi:tetratricopeptide (TPR) repeat protein
MKEFLYIVFTVILVLVYPILQQRAKDDRTKSKLFWIYLPFACLYVIMVICLALVGKQLEEKVAILEDKPGFDEEMWSMMTGIPAQAVNEMHEAEDAFDAREYDTAFKHIQESINMLEQEPTPGFKKYVKSEFEKMAGTMYQLGTKIAQRVNKHNLAYQYAKKSVELLPSYYSYYLLAAGAYNVKKYQEAKDNADIALEKGPPQIIHEKLTEIKERALAHLEKQ